jgi:hypothetical protein
MKNEKESNTIRNLEIRYSHQVTDTPNVTESSEMLFKITRLLRGKNCCLHVSRIFLFQDEKKKEEFASGGHQQQNEMDTGKKKKRTSVKQNQHAEGKENISFHCNGNSKCRTLSPSQVSCRTQKGNKKNAKCGKKL